MTPSPRSRPVRFRRVRPAPALLLVGALLAAAGPLVEPAGAQSAAATIAGILDLAEGGGRRTLDGPTRRVVVQPAGSNDWLDGRKDLELFLADQVLVEPRTVVRLGLSAGAAAGSAHLTADLQTADGALVLDEIGGNDAALYEIGEAPRELGDLALTVARGSLALDWARGRLVLFAAGIRAVVTGTRLVVAVGADGERGLLHLIEGGVSFPDFPDVSLRAGDWAVFVDGVPTAVGRPAPENARRLADAADWSSQQAWPRPFYRNPWVWGGAAAAIGAAALLTMGQDEDYRIPGLVILRFPF